MSNKRKSTGDKTRKKQLGLLVALALIINFYLILSFFFGEMGFLNANQLKRTNQEIQKEVVFFERENEGLKTRIDALLNDPETIERLARKRIGLVKEGELVYEFINAERP